MDYLDIKEDFSLRLYNTFGVDVKAKYFVDVHSTAALAIALNHDAPKLILGGGSNVLFTNDVDALVIHILIKGIDIIHKDEASVMVRVGAGETWHPFVLWCVHHDFGGLENLALIPGYVGAAPVQNIGAYGVEVKDRIVEVEAVHLKSKTFIVFANNECGFGYRSSVFNTTAKDEYVIIGVTFKLSRHCHTFNTSYGAINNIMNQLNVTRVNVKAISDIVLQIRHSKLPDHRILGNAGSFFRNPIISTGLFEELQRVYPGIPGYGDDKGVKVPAGWLIEKAGWRGRIVGNVGVYEKHAVVIVKLGNASGLDILNLSVQIQQHVFRLYKVLLVPEVIVH